MKRVRRSTTKNQLRTAAQQAMALDDGTLTTAAAVAVIQARIPLGLQAVEAALVEEVSALAGPRHARHDGHPAVVRAGAGNAARSISPIRSCRSRCRACAIVRSSANCRW